MPTETVIIELHRLRVGNDFSRGGTINDGDFLKGMVLAVKRVGGGANNRNSARTEARGINETRHFLRRDRQREG